MQGTPDAEDIREFEMKTGLNWANYFHPVTHFDIVKLDIDMNTPDGVSIRQEVERRWGKEIAEIVRKYL